jgi:hypothetical protein
MAAAGVQLQRTGDQREVAEGLRCVAQLAAADGIPFLAEQAHVVAQSQ